MPISSAWRLCKQGEAHGGLPCIFVGGVFSRYAEVSSRIMDIVRIYAARFEQVSVDEAYFIPKIKNYKEAELLAKNIKREILKKERLTCSIGIGPNKLVAKIASDFQKPNGLTAVLPSRVQDFLDPLGIRVIPGIGPKAAAELHILGVSTIQELRQIPLLKMRRRFGAWGIAMYEHARGKGDALIEENHKIKSLGRQETFEEDTADPAALFQTLHILCRNVARDVKAEGVSFRVVELTVRFANFHTQSHQESLSQATDDTSLIEKTSIKLILPYLDGRKNPLQKKIRLLGVRVSNLKTS